MVGNVAPCCVATPPAGHPMQVKLAEAEAGRQAAEAQIATLQGKNELWEVAAAQLQRELAGCQVRAGGGGVRQEDIDSCGNAAVAGAKTKQCLSPTGMCSCDWRHLQSNGTQRVSWTTPVFSQPQPHPQRHAPTTHPPAANLSASCSQRRRPTRGPGQRLPPLPLWHSRAKRRLSVPSRSLRPARCGQ
jgi:hypothetical protein